jgi:rfaE bifunctional protein kinase chain/domain
MELSRFQSITGQYQALKVAVIGDFCLDRYLEIDPARQEISLETGLVVHNVVNVRAQPGGAGTILNNLCALGIGTIYPVGFAGTDGEGYELLRALQQTAGVCLEHFIQTPLRRTFTYCKPLVLAPGFPPQELNRLDSKNWSLTPVAVRSELANKVTTVSQEVNTVIVLDQVDFPGTGVISEPVLEVLGRVSKGWPSLPIVADSRRGLGGFPPLIWKMNRAELAMLSGLKGALTLDEAREAAVALSRRNGRVVFVTLSEEGILGAGPDGASEHVPCLPIRGEIDIVGAGDAVSANLAAALAAGSTLRESLEIANAAASVVVHKLGTTGTANPAEITPLVT